MTAKLKSIQGERQDAASLANVRCRAFNKHDLDGHVTQERWGGKTLWIARLQCSCCGTYRVDAMKPKTCELVARTYVHPSGYDGKMSPAEARKIIYRHMMDNGVSLASLAG